MTEKSESSEEEAAVEKVLRSAVHNVVKAGNSPQEIRSALGLSGTTNTLHVQNGTSRIQIDSPDGAAFFVQESGPIWVQYIDHRPKAEWENDVVSPVEFDPGLRIDFEHPDRG